jgi:4,5-dihydroxyphthalate decarboxylase
MLRELYGYRAADNQWYVGRTPEHSHAALLGLDESLPRGVSVTWLKQEGALNALLHAGEIDAAYGASGEMPVTGDSPSVRPLFPDNGRAFTEAFVRKAGFGPVNHTVIVQRRILEKDPWVAEALLEAFERAKQEAYRRDPAAAALFPEQDPAAERAVFGDDPYPTGLAANRAMLRMVAEQEVDDGLVQHVVEVDELFHETVRGS